jgi:hypothetical protein
MLVCTDALLVGVGAVGVVMDPVTVVAQSQLLDEGLMDQTLGTARHGTR